MASIRKRGSKYFLDYYVHGKRIRKVVGTSKEQAQKALDEFEANVDQLKISCDFINLLKRFKQHAQQYLSPLTRSRYQSILNNFQQFLTDTGLENQRSIRFTPNLFNKYIESRHQKHIHPRTINAELTVLRMVFRLAVQWDVLETNPLRDVKNLKVEKTKHVRFFTPQEVERLLSQCNEELYRIIFTFLSTGLRKDELESLSWDDIDFESCQIRLTDRRIPINDGLNQVLQEQLYLSRGSSFVFPHKNGKKLPGSRLYIDFKELAKQAGIEDATQISVLRHTFAANLLLKGASISALKQVMGYSTANALNLLEQIQDKEVDEIIEEV